MSAGTLTELHPSIQELDLSLIEWRLEHKLGWDADRIATAVEGYRQFLDTILRHPGAKYTAPKGQPDVDEVWHACILHTRKYAEDCERIFGYFVHHGPKGPDACDCDYDCMD